jgi:hypothetical protein
MQTKRMKQYDELSCFPSNPDAIVIDCLNHRQLDVFVVYMRSSIASTLKNAPYCITNNIVMLNLDIKSTSIDPDVLSDFERCVLFCICTLTTYRAKTSAYDFCLNPLTLLEYKDIVRKDLECACLLAAFATRCTWTALKMSPILEAILSHEMTGGYHVVLFSFLDAKEWLDLTPHARELFHRAMLNGIKHADSTHDAALVEVAEKLDVKLIDENE